MGNRSHQIYRLIRGFEKNILIVDDEPDMTRMLIMALEREGFLIDAYNDPALALETYSY